MQSGSGLSVLMFLLRFGTNTIRWRFVYEIVFVGGCFTAAATDEIYSYKRKGKFETQVSSASAACIHITRYFVRTHTHTHTRPNTIYISLYASICIRWGCLPLLSILHNVNLPVLLQRICSILQRTLVIEYVCTRKFIHF